MTWSGAGGSATTASTPLAGILTLTATAATAVAGAALAVSAVVARVEWDLAPVLASPLLREAKTL